MSMTREESDALCRELTNLHGYSFKAMADRLWQVVHGLQAPQADPLSKAQQAVLKAVRGHRMDPHSYPVYRVLLLDEEVERLEKQAAPTVDQEQRLDVPDALIEGVERNRERLRERASARERVLRAAAEWHSGRPWTAENYLHHNKRVQNLVRAIEDWKRLEKDQKVKRQAEKEWASEGELPCPK